MIALQTPPLTAPDGCIIAAIEEGRPALSASVPRLTAIPAEPGNFILENPCAAMARVPRAQAISHLLHLRSRGATLLLLTHDEPLIEACADELWWLRDGQLIAQGDPAQILYQYRAHCSDILRASGEGKIAPLTPTLRTGDGRARLESIELAGASGQPSTVFRCGEDMAVCVTVRFAEMVANPVIGVLIRTRIGLNVYGTNTELEQIALGPVSADQTLRTVFRFRCDLCPGDYTLTAASHDPDGAWHDWLEDAVAFAVTDDRYTAGVANLRAVCTSTLNPSR